MIKVVIDTTDTETGGHTIHYFNINTTTVYGTTLIQHHKSEFLCYSLANVHDWSPFTISKPVPKYYWN
jgi:hypothetical protein